MKREAQKIAKQNNALLRIGYYKGYQGNELSEAITEFALKFPAVEVTIMVGSHEDLYRALENDEVDLVLNDQRRAFSDRYHNEILSDSHIFIEISNHNPLSRLNKIEVSELKNTPCILLINPTAQQEEQKYYEDVIGLRGDFVFSESIQEARLKIITGQGYMPVDVIGNPAWFDLSIAGIPLVQDAEPVRNTYCAFWRKDNS